MVDFGSWLRTPALTKVFPALAPVAPQVLRGFFFGLMASNLAVLALTTAGGGASQTLFPIIERGRRDRVERSRYSDGLYATCPGIVGWRFKEEAPAAGKLPGL
jgi:hypothetical protein